MNDDKNKRTYQDRARINTHEAYEVSYWTKKWHISSQQLRGAIRATESNGVKRVEEYLKQKGVI